MSYILDALVKADRARPGQPLPDPRLSHFEPLPARRGPHHWPAVVSGVALLSGIMAIAWGMLERKPWPVPVAAPLPPVEGKPVSPVQITEALPDSPPTRVDREVPPPVAAPLPVATSPSSGETAARENRDSSGELPRRTPRTRPESRLYTIAELPAAMQKDAEKLVVAGFAYASDANQRMAIINDRPWREGEEVTKGLRVEKISGDGVLFNWNGYRFLKGRA